MNIFHIKLLAVVTMVIDHIGIFFFPQEFVFRLIGRIAFPLFAWLIANGAYHTRNIRQYIFRIFLLASISQIPYMMTKRLLDQSSWDLNVLFTLGVGLTAIMFIRKTKNWLFWMVISLMFGLTAQLLHMDYGLIGVLMIVCFYVFFNKFAYMFAAQVALTLLTIFFQAEYASGSIQYFGLFALVFLWFYNKKEGMKMRYAFYFFYPLQFVAILIVKRWF